MMHRPINVKSPNNISKWQMGFNSAFKGLRKPVVLEVSETNPRWNQPSIRRKMDDISYLHRDASQSIWTKTFLHYP
jgi:hypothetical protein